MSCIVIVLFHLIYFQVLVNGSKYADNDWFFRPNFTDGTKYDNDIEREFWRHSTVNDVDIIITTTDDPDYPESDTKTTDDQDYPETETNVHHLTTVADTEADRERAYYEKRKQQALECKGTKQFKIEDEFDCQLCTCDGAGVMLCTRNDCGQNDHEDVDKAIYLNQSQTIWKAMNTNPVFREYASGCIVGQDIKIGICNCACKIPNVLSCPMKCFYTEDDYHQHTGNDDGTTEDYKTTDDYETTDDYTTIDDYKTTEYQETTKTFVVCGSAGCETFIDGNGTTRLANDDGDETTVDYKDTEKELQKL